MLVAASIGCSSTSNESLPYAMCKDDSGDLEGTDRWVDIESVALRRNDDNSYSALVTLAHELPTDSWDGAAGSLGLWVRREWQRPDGASDSYPHAEDRVAQYRLDGGGGTPEFTHFRGTMESYMPEDLWIQLLDGGTVSVHGNVLELDLDENETLVPEEFTWSVGLFFQDDPNAIPVIGDWASEDWCPTTVFAGGDPDAMARFPGDHDSATAAKQAFASTDRSETERTTPPSTAPTTSASTTSAVPPGVSDEPEVARPVALGQEDAAQRLLDAWNAADPGAAAYVATDDVVRFVFSEPTNRDARLLSCRHWSDIEDGEYQEFGTFVCEGLFNADWMSDQTIQLFLDGGASAGYEVIAVGFNNNPPGWRPVD